MSPRPGRALELCAVGALAAMMAGALLVLLLQPLRGLAENGDGHRVMQPAGLEYVTSPEDFRFRYVERYVAVRDAPLGGVTSSGALLAWFAARVPLPGVPHGLADIRQFGLAHAVIAMLFLAHALVRRVDPLAAMAVTAAFAGPEVVLGFNGLHPDVAATLGLYGLVLACLEPRDGSGPGGEVPRRMLRGRLVACAVAAVLVAASSRAHLLVAALAGVALLVAPRGRSPLRDRRALAMSALLASLLGGWLFTAGPGPRFEGINEYHAVYRGLAELADDRAEVLAELGLPADSLALVGRSYFAVTVPDDVARALERLPRRRILVGYLERPVAMRRALGRVARTLASPVPTTLGSYAREAGHPRPTPPGRGFGLRALRTSGGALGLGASLLVVVLAAGLGVRRRTDTSDATAALFALLVIVVQIPVVLLGDGTFALRRHLLVTTLALDVLFGLSLLALCRGLAHALARSPRYILRR